MVSVTYSDAHNMLNLAVTDISAAKTESLIDQAIDLLNLYSNVSLSNMSGVAGAKTVTLTSRQRGAVLQIVANLYYRSYKPQESSAVGALSQNPSMLEDPSVQARRLGNVLSTHSIYRG